MPPLLSLTAMRPAAYRQSSHPAPGSALLVDPRPTGHTTASTGTLSDTWKGHSMNTIKPMNLNDFCAAHAFDIPSFEDDRSETWLILTTKLSEALELPDDDEISDLLSSEAYRTEMPANGESQSDARHFISERGLYCLIFTSTAPTFKTFRDWALHVVLPIALEDAFHLGVLSSRIHVAWALAAGGRRRVLGRPCGGLLGGASWKTVDSFRGGV